MARETSAFYAADDNTSLYWRITVLIALCKFICNTDFAAVSVALPSILHTFALTPAQIPWVVSTFSLIYAGFLVLGGRLADEYGQRRCCLIGLALFGAGAVTGMLAPDFPVLLFGRAIQGFGSALLIPASFSLINVALPDGPVRHRAFGFFSITNGVSVVAGLALGGLVTTVFSWRSVFLLDCPLVLSGLLLTYFTLPANSGRQRRAGLNIGGSLLITAGIGLFLYSISALGRANRTPVATVVPFTAGLLVFGAFLLHERRLRSPLIPAALVSSANFLGGNLTVLASFATIGAMFALLPFYMQKGLEVSAMTSGALMLPFALGNIVGGFLVGWSMSRIPVRTSILIGAALAIGGALVLAWAADGLRYNGLLVVGMLCVGIGGSLAVALSMALTTRTVPVPLQGIATGVLVTFQQIGVAVGVSVAATSLQMALVGPGNYRQSFLIAAALATLLPVVLVAGTRSR